MQIKKGFEERVLFGGLWAYNTVTGEYSQLWYAERVRANGEIILMTETWIRAWVSRFAQLNIKTSGVQSLTVKHAVIHRGYFSRKWHFPPCSIAHWQPLNVENVRLTSVRNSFDLFEKRFTLVGKHGATMEVYITLQLPVETRSWRKACVKRCEWIWLRLINSAINVMLRHTAFCVGNSWIL